MDIMEYTKRDKMCQLSDEQRMFAARRLILEANRIAEEMGISEEAAYELYIKGTTEYDIFRDLKR